MTPETSAPERLGCQSDYGIVHLWAGKPDTSGELLGEALTQARSALGNEHELTIELMQNLASVHGRRREFDEAEALTEEAATLQRVVFGEDHANTLVAESNLATMRYRRGRFDEAQALFAGLRPRFEQVFGVEHRRTLTLDRE